MASPPITFEPLKPLHAPLLHGWLQEAHVREFWDDGDRTLEQVRAHYFEPDWDAVPFLIVLGGLPIGYIQTYPVDAESEFAVWRGSSGETWGIDLFIGERAWLGRGLAGPIIQAFLGLLRALHPALRRVLIDPETRNIRARHVYAKAGFVPLTTVEVEGKELGLMGLDI